MKVFLDANVLFSASDENSATRSLLNLLMQQAETVSSPHTWEEARRNIERKRPHLLPGLMALQQGVTITRAFRLPPDVEMVDKDKPVIAGAIGGACTHLWTSDRLHFGHLFGKTVHGVAVVSSLQLVDLLGSAPPAPGDKTL